MNILTRLTSFQETKDSSNVFPQAFLNSEMCPKYMNKIYKTTDQNNTATRNSSLKLFQPYHIGLKL